MQKAWEGVPLRRVSNNGTIHDVQCRQLRDRRMVDNVIPHQLRAEEQDLAQSGGRRHLGLASLQTNEGRSSSLGTRVARVALFTVAGANESSDVRATWTLLSLPQPSTVATLTQRRNSSGTHRGSALSYTSAVAYIARGNLNHLVMGNSCDEDASLPACEPPLAVTHKHEMGELASEGAQCQDGRLDYHTVAHDTRYVL